MSLIGSIVLLVILLVARLAPAADPLDTIRNFCRVDGLGARLTPRDWREKVAPLVTWPLEPAWDHVHLIGGYEIGTPKLDGKDVVVSVSYTIVADVTAGHVTKEPRIETHTFRLAGDDQGSSWLLAGAPPVPHVFASEVDEQAMAKSLDPDAQEYLSNSGFVWQMLRAAGWAVPYQDTPQLASAPELTSTEAPMFGDVAVYYDGADPYHVGFVDEDNRVLSSTLNGGLRRTAVDAFPGEHRYFRLRAFASVPATPTAEPVPAAQLPSDTHVE